jgi:hypothetical protein
MNAIYEAPARGEQARAQAGRVMAHEKLLTATARLLSA